MLPVAPATGPREVASRSYVCCYGCINRRYSNEHSRRQHYRRHHKDQLRVARCRPPPDECGRLKKRQQAVFSVKRLASTDSCESADNNEGISVVSMDDRGRRNPGAPTSPKDRTVVPSHSIATQQLSDHSPLNTLMLGVNSGLHKAILGGTSELTEETMFSPTGISQFLVPLNQRPPASTLGRLAYRIGGSFSDLCCLASVTGNEIMLESPIGAHFVIANGPLLQEIGGQNAGNAATPHTDHLGGYQQRQLQTDALWPPTSTVGLTKMTDPVFSNCFPTHSQPDVVSL